MRSLLAAVMGRIRPDITGDALMGHGKCSPAWRDGGQMGSCLLQCEVQQKAWKQDLTETEAFLCVKRGRRYTD